MDAIRVATPLGALTIEHSGTKAKALGPRLAVEWWDFQVKSGAFGTHGHIFIPDDCDICDLLAAAISVVGPDRVVASADARKRAARQMQSIPKGVVP